MNNNHLPIYPSTATPEERAANHQTMVTQLKEIKCQEYYNPGLHATTIHCNCGNVRHWTRVFRCLYCGVWFCQECAEEHFGFRKNPEIILHLLKEEE